MAPALSADGQLAYTVDSDIDNASLQAWNIAGPLPRLRASSPLPGNSTDRLDLGRSGDFLSITDTSGRLQVWDARRLEPVGQPSAPLEFSLSPDVSWSQDDRRIATMDRTGRLVLRPVLQGWADDLCAKLPRNMSHAEWQAEVGADIPYQRQCPNLPDPPDLPGKSVH